MENEFYQMSRKYFPNESDVELDFGLIAGVGGAAVVVNITPDKVAKVEKIEIAGNKKEAEKVAERSEFVTIKQVVEQMESTAFGGKKFDCSMILQPEKVFLQKIEGNWYLVIGKIINTIYFSSHYTF